MGARGAGAWILVPQAVSRLTSIYVFAMVASRADPGHLGALAIGTAMSSAALALAPAVIGKPLAATTDPTARREQAPRAQAAAVSLSLAVAVVVALAALPASGLTRLALLTGALGLPAVMAVESAYWRSIFLAGPRTAGLGLSAAYAVQALVVTAAALWLPLDLVVLSVPAGLVLPGVVAVLLAGDLTPGRAKEWLTTSRGRWLPYVAGVAASVALVQAIPAVLTATAGFGSASTYRAGELAFGGTNLLIGVASQTLITQGTTRARTDYARLSLLLVAVAGVNALALHLAPARLLEALLGPTAPLLLDALPLVSAQRAALAVSSIGAAILLARVSARRVGVLDIVAAATSLTALLTGALVGGLNGGLAGLTVAELVMAAVFFRQLRRAT